MNVRPSKLSGNEPGNPMEESVQVYEVRACKDGRSVDLISDVLPVQPRVIWRTERESGGHPTRSDRPKPSQGHRSVCALDFRPGYSTASVITYGTVQHVGFQGAVTREQKPPRGEA